MKLNFKLIDGSEKNFTINEDKVIIGRSKNCNVVIPFDGFSRQHCLIEIDQGEIFITDLNSSNGVYINDEKIVPQKRMPYKTFLPLAIGGAFAVQIDLQIPKDITRTLRNLLNLDKIEDKPESNKVEAKKFQSNNILKFESNSKKATVPNKALKTDWLKFFKNASILGFLSLLLYLGYVFKDRILNTQSQDEEIYMLQHEEQMKSKNKDGSIKTKDF